MKEKKTHSALVRSSRPVSTLPTGSTHKEVERLVVRETPTLVSGVPLGIPSRDSPEVSDFRV